VRIGTGHGVRDVPGWHYWLDPSDRMLLGYPRARVASAACVTMLAVGGTQYGFAVVSLGTAGHGGAHWGPLAAGWGFAAWIACQSAAIGALLWLRRRRCEPAAAVTVGAACCALGLLLVSRIADPVGALTVYTVSAGTGAGLVYGACVAVIADWFPGLPVPAVLVSGVFGTGAVQVALAIAGIAGSAAPLNALAWVIATVTALCAPLLRDAPRTLSHHP
jgi:MFS family permease